MAITVEVRAELIKLVVGMFNAAPGFTIMTDLAVASNAGSSVAQIAASLEQSTEFKSIYPVFLTNNEFATNLVNNMVGNLVSATEKAWAVSELVAELNAGASRSAVVLAAVTALSAVPASEANWGAASTAFANKVDVATYFTVEKQQSGASLAALQAVIENVDNTAASVTAAKNAIDGITTVGQTFTFTTGIDNFVGTNGDDTFNAVVTATSAVLGGLDSIDGSGGNDTFNVTDTATAAGTAFTLPLGLTVKNVENMQVTTNGGVTLNTTAFTGMTNVTTLAAGTANTSVTAAGTTNVNTTTTGAATTTVSGGKAVNVTAGADAAATVSVTGAALTAVSVKAVGGATAASGAVTVNNTGATSISMTSVSLENVSAAAGLTGLALSTLNLTGATNATYTTTITNNNPAGHAFTINASGAGIDGGSATAAFLAGGAKVDNANATSLTINSAGSKNSLDVSGFTSAKSVAIAGASALTLVGGTAASVTSIDGSAATGALTLGTISTTATSVKTGSGNDSMSLGAAKYTVETGAGNDTVTLTGALAAGSTINLGDGNDRLLVNGGSVAASTTGNVTVIDGGAGTNTVAAALINAANAAQFKNFQNIDISSATATALDVQLMTSSTITGLTLSGGTGGATVNNVATGVGLSVTGSNTGTSTINVKDAGLATSTTDSLAVTFAGTTGTVAAGTVVANKVEGFNITSGGSTGTNTITLTSDTMKTVTVTGSKALTLSFAGANGTAAPNGVSGAGVTTIDASAATGIQTIDTTNVTAATAGLTVSTGSAADVITLAQKATVNAGAGNDTINVALAGATVTGGAGNDTFNFQAAVAEAGSLTEATGVIKNVITDFSAGDKITLLAAATVGALGAKIELGGGVTNFDQALAQATITPASNAVTWFQYAGDTFIVSNEGTLGFGAGDILIKLTGLVDLSTATVAAGGELSM